MRIKNGLFTSEAVSAGDHGAVFDLLPNAIIHDGRLRRQVGEGASCRH